MVAERGDAGRRRAAAKDRSDGHDRKKGDVKYQSTTKETNREKRGETSSRLRGAECRRERGVLERGTPKSRRSLVRALSR